MADATETTMTLKETATHQDENGLAVVEDFEKYDTTDDLLDFWYYGKNYVYQDATLSNDVAYNGGNHSGKFQFKSNSESPSYYLVPTLASDVTAKGIRFSLKSDISATVYINFYVKIGTKKQLSAAGLLKGGFLQKKKVSYENVDKSKFNAVDIRKFREIQLHSNNPKILTPQPSNRSFHFEESGDGNCTLVITNPTLFWSVSNYLIIQL